MRNFYPTRTADGVKAILLPKADQNMVYDFFISGLVSIIYLSPDLKEIIFFKVSESSSNVQT